MQIKCSYLDLCVAQKIYTMNHPKFIVSYQVEESIEMKMVHKALEKGYLNKSQVYKTCKSKLVPLWTRHTKRVLWQIVNAQMQHFIRVCTACSNKIDLQIKKYYIFK